MLLRLALMILTGVCFTSAALHASNTRDEVREAMHRAVTFFRQHASAGGGYVFQLSADLSQREGEGKVGPTTAWIQPPATPSIGMVYLESYQRCGEPFLLDAAKETARALVQGQMRSGGWSEQIEFDPSDRVKYAYRVEPDDGGKRRDITTFDDDKSQSVIRFLMRLDQELDFKDAAIHEALQYALDAVAQVLRERPGALTYHVVGDGPLRAELEAQAERNGLREYVTFHGWKDRAAATKLLDEMHLMLLPSTTAADGDREGIPVSLMEAMARGLPVVSTRHSGIPELVEAGCSGFLAEERDVPALVECLRALLDHPDMWSGFGRAGRERVEEAFDIHRLNDDLSRHLDSIVSSAT